ncbi:hypothetical protein ONS95_008633 [Cadophora gregata]|uniref:uncharacterized protein n=1 Tax=Cadophora gregata TaxID=51156 RepID=UPI0026DD4766|nr:uncharacterized protein ONS95_008633 [Cadophora gregata]KAK0123617.1 hypothetical protein ONS95_008633 [Cadophora gregata]
MHVAPGLDGIDAAGEGELKGVRTSFRRGLKTIGRTSRTRNKANNARLLCCHNVAVVLVGRKVGPGMLERKGKERKFEGCSAAEQQSSRTETETETETEWSRSPAEAQAVGGPVSSEGEGEGEGKGGKGGGGSQIRWA